MKKTLLILCALLLTAVGASAQVTAYSFNAEDWVALSDHQDPSGNNTTVEATDDNTIAVTYTGDNAGIGNMGTMAETDANTADYYVTAEQHWFVIKGKGLSTTGTHLLWWMNGQYGLNVAPSEVITLESDVVMLAWDLSKSGYDVNLQNETNVLSGGICFGLIADNPTTGFTITDINFYTEEEVEELLNTTAYTFNASEWVAISDHGETSAEASSDNTISVMYTGTEAGIGNSPTASNNDPTIGVTTGLYTITKDQHWFVIEGTGLSTTSTDHQLWWMNGQGGFTLSPTVYELDESVVLAWDLSGTTAFPDATNLFDGWTCFGLKAAEYSTSGSFTISDINFYTETDFETLISATPYTFNCKDWVESDSGRAPQSSITYNADGTITVAATGANNIAMGNSNEKSQHGGITTANKYITSEQKYFVIIGSDLATGKTVDANGACDSYLWWVNGFNDGSQIAPDEVVTLSDDQVLVAWDISSYVTAGEDGKIILNGWTCFGLTSTDTDGKSTISYIGFYTKAQLDAATSGVEWEMTDAGYGTLILPFDVAADDVPEELVAYTIASVTPDEEDGIVATLTLAEAEDAIAANTPYIMGVADGATGYAKTYTFTGTPENTQNSYTKTEGGVSLTGTFVDMSYDNFTVDGTEYVLQDHGGDDGLAFYPIVSGSSSDVTLNAYHCYLTYDATQFNKLNIAFAGTDDETTAIVAVESAEAEANGAIYDLSGRKVSKAVKGVYIQNGKKVLVK